MDHPYSISDFAFAFRRSEGTPRDLIERSTEPSRGNGSQSRPDPFGAQQELASRAPEK